MTQPISARRWTLTLQGYLALPHPTGVVLVMGATALFGLLASHGRPDPGRYGLLLLSMFGGQIAIGALNEYCDRELDAVGNPRKPIPAGLVTPRAALIITFAGLVTMLAAVVALGPLPLLVGVVGTGAGLAYDLWLKRTVWSWLPYLIALPIVPIWAWVSVARFDQRLLLLYPIGALMIVAIHLAQSLPDAVSDRAAGVNTLVARLGRRCTRIACFGAATLGVAGVVLAALLLTPHPLYALLPAAAVFVTLIVAGLLLRHAPATVDRHLFKLLGACGVALATGWLLALGL